MRFSDARARLVVLGLCTVLLAVVLVALVDRDRDHEPLQVRTVGARCADVLLVLAPGNGDGVTQTRVVAGRTLDDFRDRYLAAARPNNRTVTVRVLQYRTQRLSALNPHRPAQPANKVVKLRHLRNWDRGLTAAVRDLRDLLLSAQRSCPDQNIVLAGHAQGAAAVHRALAGFSTRSSVMKRVVGALLISDPDRAPRTRARITGDPRATRAAIGIERKLSADVRDVPLAGTSNRIYSECRSQDILCDFGRQTVHTGLTVALNYYKTQTTPTKNAALTLFQRTRAVPKPMPQTLELSAMAGVPMTRQLQADTRPVFQKYLRWAPTTALPAGVTLSDRGVLSGQPSTAGTYTIGYTVQNTVYPGVNRPVAGTVVMKVTPNRLSVNTAGGDSSCTVRADSTLWCWGDNYDGQLGQGNRTNQLSPARVGSGAYWQDVSTSGTHTCGIRTGGGLWCTGRNDFGQLGDGTRTRRLRPARVVGGLTWASVSTGIFNTCGITRDKALYCWGKNDEGQVGDSTTTTRIQPVRIGAANDWASVTTGAWHSCAVKTDGAAWCWGDNSFGQLGNGRSINGRTYPVRVAGGYAWSTISAGAMHSCGITADGAARCWGANTSGQLGTGDRQNSLAPVPVSGGLQWGDVEVGTLSSCGVDSDGVARCWGAGETGALGRDGVRSSDTPQAVSSSSRFVRVNLGWAHACGTRTDGDTLCWGLSSAGQVGDGTHATHPTPIRVLGG